MSKKLKRRKMDQPTTSPTEKVKGAGVGGSLASLAVGLIIAITTGGDVEAAAVAFGSGLGATVSAFLVAYVRRELADF